MGTKSPNKNFSLSKLERIKENNYYDENTCIDYNDSEIDQMIFTRQAKINTKEFEKLIIELKLKEIEADKTVKIKRCATCKWKLPFSYFSPDKTKKHFKLKSSCKPCRCK